MRVGARVARLAGREVRALRRQHAAGRGHRGRQGRGGSALRLFGQRLRRRRSGEACRWRERHGGRRSFAPSTSSATTWSKPLRKGGDRHDVAARWRADRAGPARLSSRRAASRASPTTFEDLHGLKQLPGLAVQRLMADGYGFGARRRLENLRPAARDESDGRRTCPAAPRSWRITPITSSPTRHQVLGSHMLEICESIAGGQALARDSSARHRRQGRPGPARLRLRRPGRALNASLIDLGQPLPPARQRSRCGRAARSRCRSCPSLARSGNAGPISRRPARPGFMPAARITPASATR